MGYILQNRCVVLSQAKTLENINISWTLTFNGFKNKTGKKNRKNQDKKSLSDFCAGSKTNNKKINFNLNYETGSQKKKDVPA